MIENEAQEVEYFNNRSLVGNMSGWGSVGQWGRLKREMLNHIWPFNSMLDIGCGDMIYLSSFKPFVEREFRYFGVDGSLSVLDKAKKMYPLHSFCRLMISDLIEGGLNQRFEVIVCYDVLFHIVEDDLYEDFLQWLFNSSAKHLLLTYLRVDEGEGQHSDKGHFIIRDFGKIVIPDDWKIVVEKKSSNRPRQRIALLSRTNG